MILRLSENIPSTVGFEIGEAAIVLKNLNKLPLSSIVIRPSSTIPLNNFFKSDNGYSNKYSSFLYSQFFNNSISESSILPS